MSALAGLDGVRAWLTTVTSMSLRALPFLVLGAVLASTAVAFGGDWHMVLARLLASWATAVVVG